MAKVGTSFRTAFSKPISVSGFFSLLMITAASKIFSKRQSLTHNSSEYRGSISMAVGIANERESRLVLADRGLPLTFKQRIDQRELPGRRSLLGKNAIASAIEMQIF